MRSFLCRDIGSEIQPDASLEDTRDSGGQTPNTATKASMAVFSQLREDSRLMSNAHAGPSKDPQNPGDGYFDPSVRQKPGKLLLHPSHSSSALLNKSE